MDHSKSSIEVWRSVSQTAMVRLESGFVVRSVSFRREHRIRLVVKKTILAHDESRVVVKKTILCMTYHAIRQDNKGFRKCGQSPTLVSDDGRDVGSAGRSSDKTPGRIVFTNEPSLGMSTRS